MIACFDDPAEVAVCFRPPDQSKAGDAIARLRQRLVVAMSVLADRRKTRAGSPAARSHRKSRPVCPRSVLLATQGRREDRGLVVPAACVPRKADHRQTQGRLALVTEHNPIPRKAPWDGGAAWSGSGRCTDKTRTGSAPERSSSAAAAEAGPQFFSDYCLRPLENGFPPGTPRAFKNRPCTHETACSTC